MTMHPLSPVDAFADMPRGPSPSPRFCDVCKESLTWVSGEGRAVGRWVILAHTDCDRRRVQQERRAEERGLRTLAEVPAKDRGWSFDRIEYQRPDTGTDAEFMAWCGAQVDVLGVLARNVRAVGVARAWRPEHGSVWIEGAVGRGKTALGVAMLMQAMDAGGMTWEPYDAEHMARRYGADYNERPLPRGVFGRYVQRKAWPGLMVDETELFARERLSWARDKTPMARISRSPLMMLDDMGACIPRANGNGPTKRPAEWAQAAIERLITVCYRERQPMIITSNFALGDITAPRGPFGARVGDRLREMVGNRVIVLGGPSWRR